jgi:hypothetical protein
MWIIDADPRWRRHPIGKKILMSSHLSLTIFTIEIDGIPTLALQAKKHREVEAICEQPSLRTDLTALYSNGVPLCRDHSTFRVRLAHAAEAIAYRESIEGIEPSDDLKVVYLVDVDDDHFLNPK